MSRGSRTIRVSTRWRNVRSGTASRESSTAPSTSWAPTSRRLFQAGASLLGQEMDDEQLSTLDLLVVGLIGQVRGSVNQWVRRPERTLGPRALTSMLSRWIWYQIDGQAREIGVELDPKAPLDSFASP